MNTYAVYVGESWLFDIKAPNEAEALARAQALDATATRVQLTAEAR
jgi:hypothetical protein